MALEAEYGGDRPGGVQGDRRLARSTGNGAGRKMEIVMGVKLKKAW